MKIYTVVNEEQGYNEDFTSLTEAKKAMREHDGKGYITQVWVRSLTVACDR